MTEATPARIGPYRILRRLGGGGMGVVYDAAHDASGDRVALKTVRAPAEWLVAGIRREIRALMGLTHPGIVRILGEGVEGGAPWYVMELVPGTTLREHGSWARAARRTSAATGAGDDGPAAHRAAGNIGSTERLARTTARVDGAPASAAHIREAQAAAALGEGLGLMRCLCATLAYLHGEGLVHGDLKPDNVVVRPDGVPVVMDFGVATRFAGEIARESLHELSHGFGTLAYMAPEQIQGHPLDARTDLYALGCILYELVCGRTPFVGQTTREIASKHLHTRPTPPRQMVDGIPSELDELIVALLAKSPRDRIGHADVVAEVLASLGAAALPAGAPPPRSYLYRPGFSGRDGALADLERALARAKEGGLQLVLVGAESGAGKTRLLMALATSAHAQHVPVIRGGALPGAATPFSALRPFFLAIVDRCRERGREEVRRVLGRRAKVLAPYAELLDLPGASEDPDPASIPPDEARLRLFTALAQTVRDVADGRPLVLMLDDLHWADELTLDFLWFLCRSDFAKRMPVLVLGAYRSEERTPSLERLLATPRVQRLALAELPERAVADIAADMMASRPAPEALVSFLYRHSQGNPFFVAEYLRTAVGEGVLARDRAGRWRLIEGRDYQALALPSSLQDLVTRRLGRIDARASSLARAAAVLGREMTPDLLAAMTGLSHEETATLLAALVRHHVVEDTPGGRVGFVHDKVREACYAALTTEERATRHRAAAAALEAAGSDQWEALARHWQEGGDPGRACGYLLRAARHARDGHALEHAERLYREYFALAAPSAELIDAHDELGEILGPLGRRKIAVTLHRRAVELARQIGDRWREVRALRSLGETLEDVIEGEAVCREALSIAREIGNRSAEAAALRSLGVVLANSGSVADAIAAFEAAIALFRASGEREAEGLALGYLGLTWRAEGRFGKARAHLEHALAIYRDVGNIRLEGVTMGYLASLFGVMGDDDAALAMADQALAITQEVGNRRARAMVLADKAVILERSGDLAASERLLREAEAIYAEAEESWFHALTLGRLARLLSNEARVDEADALFERTVSIMRELGDRRVSRDYLARWAMHLRRTGRSPAKTLDEAESFIGDGSHVRGASIVASERGLAAIADGDIEAARVHASRARSLIAGLDIPPRDPPASRLGKLEAALQAIDEGRASEVFRGERLVDWPPKLLAFLRGEAPSS